MRLFFTLAVTALALCSPAQDAKRQAAGAGQASEEYVRISEILIDTPQPYDSGQVADAERQARHILDLIQQGENFPNLAKSHSQGPSAAFGGDVGYFRRGQLGSAIEAVAFRMDVGDVSGVIRTKQGFLIMKVTDRRWGPAGADPAQFLSSARVTPDLTVYLNRLKADVQRNWYDSIPATALNKKGEVILELVISRDGEIIDAKVAASSGDIDLDQGALAGVRKVHSLPPLPASVEGGRLSLRFRFEYNPGNATVR